MSGPTITCEIFSDRLMEFLDGDLDGATRDVMTSHARGCVACGALLADLRRVSARAAGLPVLAPSRDLWPGIAARLETPVVTLAGRRPWWRSPALLSAAVAATFVLAAVLGYATTHRAAPRSGAARAAAPAIAQRAPLAAPADTAVAASAQARLAANRAARATPAAVEQSYDTEIAALHAVLDARRSHLDTATV
ncbi:MAG: zf-HC2 domain-containing protein, partial [Gemmatimonadaceae bacterium]